MHRRVLSEPPPTHADSVMRAAMALAPKQFLSNMHASCRVSGLADAVARRDTPFLYRWLLEGFQYQGLSDAGASAFVATHGLPAFEDIERGTADRDACAKLRSHWHFEGCGFRKERWTCANQRQLDRCALPYLTLRKGALNQTAVSLFLFLRDICDGDIVGWIDHRLDGTESDRRARRPHRFPEVLLGPLRSIHGVSDKVLSMAFATLLLGADPRRERWVATGARMIAIDSLVHNHLHRSGLIDRHGKRHRYGPACYAELGCADAINVLAEGIDASQIDPSYPSFFPRLIQFAIWHFCAEGGLNICNGRQIDDRRPCRNQFCPAHRDCASVALNPDRLSPELPVVKAP